MGLDDGEDHADPDVDDLDERDDTPGDDELDVDYEDLDEEDDVDGVMTLPDSCGGTRLSTFVVLALIASPRPGRVASATSMS